MPAAVGSERAPFPFSRTGGKMNKLTKLTDLQAVRVPSQAPANAVPTFATPWQTALLNRNGSFVKRNGECEFLSGTGRWRARHAKDGGACRRPVVMSLWRRASTQPPNVGKPLHRFAVPPCRGGMSGLRRVVGRFLALRFQLLSCRTVVAKLQAAAQADAIFNCIPQSFIEASNSFIRGSDLKVHLATAEREQRLFSLPHKSGSEAAAPVLLAHRN